MNSRLIRLFRDVLDLEGPEREAFLSKHCADAGERAQIEALLKAALKTNRILPNLVLAPLELSARLAVDRFGEIVGSFRLIRALGSGGIGSVWLAERVEGFAQQAAIKWAHRTGLSAAMLTALRKSASCWPSWITLALRESLTAARMMARCGLPWNMSMV